MPLDTPKREDLMARLESAVSSWGDEVASAQEGLRSQLEQTREHLDSLVNLMSARKTASPSLSAAKLRIESMRKELASRESKAAKSVAQIGEVENVLRALREEVTLLRTRETTAVSAERLLTAELSALRGERDAATAALQRMQDEIDALGRSLGDRDGSVVAAVRRASEFQRQIIENTAVIESLRGREARASSMERILSAELDAVSADREAARSALREAGKRLMALDRLLFGGGGAVPTASTDANAIRNALTRVQSELRSLDVTRMRSEVIDRSEGTHAAAARPAIPVGDEDPLEAASRQAAELMQHIGVRNGDSDLLRGAESADVQAGIEEEFQRLRAEHGAALAAVDEARNDAGALREVIRDWEDRWSAASSERAAIERSAAEFENRCSELHRTLDERDGDVAALQDRRRQFEAELDDITAERDALRGTLGSRESDLVALSERNEVLERDVELLSQQLQALQRIAEEGACRAEQEHEEIVLARNRAGELEQDCNALRDALARRELAAETLEGERNAIDFDLAEAREERNRLHAALREAETGLANALLERQSLERRLDAVSAELAAAKDALENAESQAARVARDTERLNQEIAALTRASDEAQEANKDAVFQIVALDREAEALREETASLRAVLAEKEEALSQGSRQREQIESQLAEVTREFGRLRSLLDERDAATAVADQRLESLERQADDLSGKLSAIQDERDSMSSGLEAARAELDGFRRTCADQKATLSIEEERAHELSGEIARMARDLESARAREAQWAQTKTDLENQLQSIRAEKVATSIRLEESQIEIERLAQALKDRGSELEAPDSQTARKERLRIEEALARAEAQRRELEQTIAAQREAAASKDDVLAQLRSDQTVLHAAVEVQKEEADRFRQQAADLAQSVENLDVELDLAREELSEARAAAGALDEMTRSLEAERNRSRMLEEQLAVMSRTAQTAPGEKVLQEIVSLRAEIETLRRANENLGRQADIATNGKPPPVFEAFDARGRRRHMGEILIDAGVISDEQLQVCLSQQKENRHRRLGALLVENGFASEEVIAKALASQLKLAYVSLDDPDSFDVRVARYVPMQMAAKYGCIPIRLDDERLVVAISNPLDLIALEDMALATEREIEPVVATPSGIAQAQEQAYS